MGARRGAPRDPRGVVAALPRDVFEGRECSPRGVSLRGCALPARSRGRCRGSGRRVPRARVGRSREHELLRRRQAGREQRTAVFAKLAPRDSVSTACTSRPRVAAQRAGAVRGGVSPGLEAPPRGRAIGAQPAPSASRARGKCSFKREWYFWPWSPRPAFASWFVGGSGRSAPSTAEGCGSALADRSASLPALLQHRDRRRRAGQRPRAERPARFGARTRVVLLTRSLRSGAGGAAAIHRATAGRVCCSCAGWARPGGMAGPRSCAYDRARPLSRVGCRCPGGACRCVQRGCPDHRACRCASLPVLRWAAARRTLGEPRPAVAAALVVVAALAPGSRGAGASGPGFGALLAG